MTFLEDILNFITDNNKRLSAKAAIIILTIFSVVLIDNIVGFSFYYNKQRQLDQLKSITTILKDSTLTTTTRKKLIELQTQTFERKNIIDYSVSFLKSFSNTNIKPPQRESGKIPKSGRSNIWFLISSSGFYILVTVLLVPVLLLTDKKTSFLKLVASIIIFCLVMFFTSWFNYWLFDKIIPDKLFGSWTWNYILNFILQIGLVIGLFFASNTINKSNASR